MNQLAPHALQILVVDDDPAEVEILRAACPDHLVFHAIRDGGDVAACMVDQCFDLALVDMNLGEVHGAELVRLLRSLRSGLRVVAYSNSVAPRDIARAVAAGAHDYRLKPDSVSGVRALIAELLRAVEDQPGSTEAVGR